MSGQIESTDVLIIGAGPAGATAALALATYGTSVMFVTRYRWLSSSPRAHITNQRAMEVFRDLGVEPDLMRLGISWDQMGDNVFASSLAGAEYGRISAWGTGDELATEYRAASPSEMRDIPQNLLEPVLVSAAAGHGADLRLRAEYLSHEQDPEGVTTTLADRRTGRTFTVRSRYLIGADGARSRVAADLGIPFEGSMGRASTQYVQFKADLSRFVAHRPSTLYWLTTAASNFGEIGLGLLRAVNAWDEWLAGWGIDQDAGEPNSSPEHFRAMIRALVGDAELDVEIVRSSVWQVNEQYATRMDEGRVFVMGDAAHRHPPSGGLGSNTCVQDAFNLAWKLSYVLSGYAGPELLRSYSLERAPVGAQIVRRANQSRREFAQLTSALRAFPDPKDFFGGSPGAREAREQFNGALELKRYEFTAHGVELNQRYNSDAIIGADGDADGAWNRDEELYAQPTTAPGAKLPHAWLVDGHGQRLSTLDIVGRGCLTLVTGASGGAWKQAVDALHLPILKVAQIDGPEGPWDAYRVWTRLSGIDEAGAVLVRPDGFVAWRHPEPPRDSCTAERVLNEVLDSILSR